MKDMIRALVGTLMEQLEDIEKEMDDCLDEEAIHLQEQIEKLKLRLAAVINETALGTD